MKTWLLALSMMIGCFFFLEMPADATEKKTTQIAQLTSSKVYIYKKADAKASKSKAGSRANHSYYVRRVDGTFYRIEQGSKTIGWVKKNNLKLYNRKTISAKKDVKYIIGLQKAYAMPLARDTEMVYDLSQYVAKKITMVQYETIGTENWYKGKMGGKYVWFPEDSVTMYGYAAMNLHKASSISAKEMRAFLLTKGKTPDNILYKLAPSFIEAQKDTGINAQFMFAHAILETGWGSSVIAQYKNNFFGYQAYDSCPVTCAMYFPSGTKGLDYYAYKIHTNYLAENGLYYNGPSALAMNVRYASDRAWAQKIANLMEQMKPYNAAEYKKKKAVAMTLAAPKNYAHIIPEKKEQPVHFKAMPPNMTATTKETTTVYALPYTYARTLGTYAAKKKMKLTAYHSDVRDVAISTTKMARWYRIDYDGTQGWVRSDHLTTKTLGFITETTTAHSNAGSNYSTVSNALAYSPIQFVLKDNKKVTKSDSAKAKWYKVYLTSAPKKAVWVKSNYIKTY